ncbi:DNA-directed RNA polymerase II subunit rpb1 [Clydaea vesicula]|uniref:DNA-directed RNA polymerase n=1 Tax=Clydaea vesicula TaxID=447962 RepID=A0AAD5U8U1_9FUNG|nr:DNA-directed RNA polymerase II subunit rpb1 [Clydaea vesicula]
MEFFLLTDSQRKDMADYVISSERGLQDEKGDLYNSYCEICNTYDCHGHLGFLDLKHAYICGRCLKLSRYPLFTVLDNPELGLSKYLMRSMLVPPASIRSKDNGEWRTKLYKLYKKLLHDIKIDKYSTVAADIRKIYGLSKGDSLLLFMSGKSGIIRKICYGKRIENSARSVITGNPSIDIDQVLIPREIADILYKKHILTGNEKDLSKYFIVKDSPLEKFQAIAGLEVFRHLEDDDLVFLNRQPTLSYQSMLSFRAKIRTDNIKTIGIHPNVTKTFGADFDGDEMNIYVFFSEEDSKKCHVLNFPECINKIQDEKTFEHLGLNSYKELDNWGLTVNIDDIAAKKYNNTGLEAMIESGAKGSIKNFDQMTNKLGDQFVLGKKVGHIENSYYSGLSIDEYIIHQMAAREGIVTQGVSTSETGYINRKGCHTFADVYQKNNIIEDEFGYISFLDK